MKVYNQDLMQIENYRDAERYMYDIPKFTKKNHMDDTKAFLQFFVARSGFALGDLDGKVIHVAGTNGKGSVCTYIDYVLREAGYRTGVFTSPHLITMCERFRISGEMMAEATFVRLLCDVCAGAEAYSREKNVQYHPTFFETLFFMSVVFFLENQTDYIIMETGLGGRLDATNSIMHPVLSVITEVGLDHTEYLGETISQIAEEKAGIIKEGTPLVYWAKREQVSIVIEEYAKKMRVPVVAVKPADIKELKFHKKFIDFSMESRYYNNVKITLGNFAIYQAENAALAFRALELLMKGKIDKECLCAGFARAKWEGRMDEVLPDVFLDGAHNIDGIRALLTTVKEDACEGRRTLMFGVMKDKYYHDMIVLLAESNLFDNIVLTQVENDRALPEEQLKSEFKGIADWEVVYFPNAEDAFRYSIENKTPGDKVYVSGSLYLIGELKALLRRKLDD